MESTFTGNCLVVCLGLVYRKFSGELNSFLNADYIFVEDIKDIFRLH